MFKQTILQASRGRVLGLLTRDINNVTQYKGLEDKYFRSSAKVVSALRPEELRQKRKAMYRREHLLVLLSNLGVPGRCFFTATTEGNSPKSSVLAVNQNKV